MIGPGDVQKGRTIIACCAAGSSVARVRIRRGRAAAMVINMTKRTNAATAAGAMVSERFSHSSRRIDQDRQRVAAIRGDATAGGSGETGGTFDGVFMRLLLWTRDR